MSKFTKSLLGAGAAAAALVTAAAPAQAQRYDRYDRDRDGISAGEVIAGAVVLGGLAAILSAGDNDRYYDGYDRRGYSGYNYYNRNGGSRQAINQCVRQVEGWANRYSRSDVTQIRDIDRTRYGYRVSGNLVVQDGWRGRGNYDRYDRNDRRYGYDRGYDRGRFTCYVERGRVVDIDYSGLDNWR
jgi:hypothetical protein